MGHEHEQHREHQRLEISLRILGFDELIVLGREILKQVAVGGQKWNAIMGTQAEIVEQLNTAAAQARKTTEEIKGVQTAVNDLKDKVAVLEEAVRNQNDASPELVAAAADVKAATQEADDQIPDAPAIPPTE